MITVKPGLKGTPRRNYIARGYGREVRPYRKKRLNEKAEG
jgi:hypothetical protein